jgi:dipeptidyl aminopeptidase/acylaminoacyl peptidase
MGKPNLFFKMKVKLLILCILSIASSCSSQESILISKTKITDFSNYPFYDKITVTANNVISWKKPYRFIDSINVSKITYVSDGLKINGFCVEPKKKGNYPVIIFNRGGNQDFGALTVGLMTAWLGEIANNGYVVLSSQYRGNGGSDGKEEFGGKDINDVLKLIDLADEMETADSKKIGMYGWSRGGIMTYQALAKSDKIKAAIIGGGVSDMKATISDRPSMENVLIELVPDYEKNKSKELEKRSAIQWADKFSKEVPILLMHGNSDWRVKPEQSLKMAMQFEIHRIPYRLIIFEGGDHGINEHRSEVDEQVLNWFDKYLKSETPLPNMEYHGQ